MDGINYQNQRQELARLGGNLASYQSGMVRHIAMDRLQALAEGYGFSFGNWELTGRWQTYAELETQVMTETQVGELQGIDEVQAVETQKKPNTRKQVGILIETQGNEVKCEVCKKHFMLKRKTQRFCSDKCRNVYNNKRRK